MLRYLMGATLFGLIWASIAYTQQGISDPKQLLANVLVFIVIGTAICWLLSYIVKWFKDPK
ncbi:MAG: hypothetical protein CMM53_04935 [Rhodospirillaceae bacterium]|jgi:hypothetical protein|nr:hypothetical protein [Rhodospirillaceae bacterium]MBS40967.1 hypothetical protein [Rhodospirillales bacterium]